MSENRNLLITSCGSSARAAMAAARVEIKRGSSEKEVVIFRGTRRGATTIDSEGRDLRAQGLVSEVWQRLDELDELYPCERPALNFELDEPGGES